MATKELKEFSLVNGDVFFTRQFWSFSSVISKTEAKVKLQHVHNLSFRDNDVSLFRCL